METIQKLTKQTAEEANISLLRSRIDQQSDLICILKRRADEYMEKSMRLEDEMTQLTEERDKYVKLFTYEKKKVSQEQAAQQHLQKIIVNLKTDKNILTENLEEFKTEYEELKVQNEKMKTDRKNITEMQNTLKELDVKHDEVKQLQNQIKTNEKEFKKTHRELEKHFETYKNKANDDLKSCQNISHKTKEKLIDVEHKFSKSQQCHKDSQNQNTHLQIELVDMKDRLKEVTKHLEVEKQHTKDLSTQVDSLNNNSNRSTDKKALQSRILELETEQRGQLLQFEVYKKHAEELLQKERNLNNQLRRVRSQKSSISNVT